MKGFPALAVALMTACAFVSVGAGSFPGKESGKKEALSFKGDVFPVIKKHCLPCHAEDNFNPSELSLDSYKDLMAGGKHGAPVIPGKSKESALVQKLSENPPFGDRMPLNTKKKIEEGKAVWLTKDEIQMIADWVEQGAKDN